jgi:hypothetical protein
VQEQPLAGRGGRDRRQRRLLGRGERRRGPARADRDVCGRATDDARLQHDEPAGLEAAQRGEVAAGEARQRGEQGALAVGEALALRRRPRRAGEEGDAGLRALGGQQQRERACRRRAQVGGHPQRERDEVGRQPCLEHPARLERRVLGVRGHAGDHADDVARAEGHDEHRADADALGADVVERAAQRAGGRQRLDLGDGPHARPR